MQHKIINNLLKVITKFQISMSVIPHPVGMVAHVLILLESTDVFVELDITGRAAKKVMIV